MKKVIKEMCKWIKDYTIKNNIDTLVVGVSGGIDSAVVSTLCAETGIKTIVLNMPINSKKENTDLSIQHCSWLLEQYKNIEVRYVDLSESYYVFEKSMLEVNNLCKLSSANSKSRLRMMSLYYTAGSENGIVVGTGNKVEDFGVGFYTKYGDGGVDIAPIADLTKTQVKKLCAFFKISDDILNAHPNDGLWEDSRTDEEQIGASYEELEWAMRWIDDPIMDISNRQSEVLRIYKSFNNKNKHKMLPIPTYKLKEQF